jgi:uncharacterized protein YkwD
MNKCVTIFLVCFAFQFSAQENSAYLAGLLLSEINLLRAKKELSELQLDEILEAAAFDQAEYCSELGKLVHEQDNSKKKSVFQRVLFYEGLHAQLEENLSELSFGAKEALTPNGIREEIDSDEKLVKAILASWLEDEKSSKLNLLDPNFYKVGITAIITNEVEYLFSVVFGSEPYVSLGEEKLSLKNHGIEPFEEQKCADFNKRFPTLPELFSEAIKVKGNKVRLEYHSLPFIEQVLSSSSDAIAIDWIDHFQYECDKGTALFPGTIAKGYLQKPFKKGFLMGQNEADSIQELSVELGTVPSFYNVSSTEPNLIFIQDGVHCATVPFNRMESKNEKRVALDFAVAGESKENTHQWEDSIEFRIPLLNGGIDSLGKVKDMLNRLHFTTTASNLIVQVSPIHQSLLVNLDAREEEVSRSHIAWDSLNSFIKNTYYDLDLRGLSQVEQIVFLQEAVLTDLKLEKYLLDLNQLQYAVKGKATIELADNTEEQLALLQFFLDNNQIEPALFVQSKLLVKVRSGELEAKRLPLADPLQKKTTLAVINNQIVLESIMGAKQYGGNPIYLALFELYLINEKEFNVAFNYHTAKLDYWINNSAEIGNVEKWLKDFKKIPAQQIPEDKYARAMLNYNLLAVDYYYESGNFDKRKKAFVELMKWQASANLNPLETVDLAKTLCYQDQFSLAIQLLLTGNERQELQSGTLSYLLQIARYDRDQVNQKKYVELLQKLRQTDNIAFCDLFTVSKMGKQLFENDTIKQLYCENCN